MNTTAEQLRQSDATNLKTTILYKTGTMVKDPRTMTDTERTVWQQQCADDARAYLFSIGQPVVYRRADGCRVAEDKQGQIVVLSGAPDQVTR